MADQEMNRKYVRVYYKKRVLASFYAYSVRYHDAFFEPKECLCNRLKRFVISEILFLGAFGKNSCEGGGTDLVAIIIDHLHDIGIGQTLLRFDLLQS